MIILNRTNERIRRNVIVCISFRFADKGKRRKNERQKGGGGGGGGGWGGQGHSKTLIPKSVACGYFTSSVYAEIVKHTPLSSLLL